MILLTLFFIKNAILMKKEWKRLVSNFFALWAKKKIKKAKRIIKQHLTLNLRLKKEKNQSCYNSLRLREIISAMSQAATPWWKREKSNVFFIRVLFCRHIRKNIVVYLRKKTFCVFPSPTISIVCVFKSDVMKYHTVFISGTVVVTVNKITQRWLTAWISH